MDENIGRFLTGEMHSYTDKDRNGIKDRQIDRGDN